MNGGLSLLRAADFDWTMHLQSIWQDPEYDVPDLQSTLRHELIHKLDQLIRSSQGNSPLGWVVFGSGGAGKTHLLSFLRREAFARDVAYVLVDMTDVHDFWATVLLGYTNSLQQQRMDGKTQRSALVERLLHITGPLNSLAGGANELSQLSVPAKSVVLAELVRRLRRRYERETLLHQDTLRALVALDSDDLSLASIGLTWLHGHPLEESDRQLLGFTQRVQSPRELIAGLSWLMSLAGPTVLAFDQLDPIVAQLNLLDHTQPSANEAEEIVLARSITDNIANGLSSLRDLTRRTFTVISCLETTWASFVHRMGLSTHADRFEPGRVLRPINQSSIAESLVRGRMQAAQRATGICPPYPTWPFASEAFQQIQGISPRAMLKLCYEHSQRCLRQGTVVELRQFSAIPSLDLVAAQPLEPLVDLDRRFESYCEAAVPASWHDAKTGDECLAALLDGAARAAVMETVFPPDVDAIVDADFQGQSDKVALHARLRLIHRQQGDREEHFCLRSLQHDHYQAFQSRLRTASTQAGIDRRLSFRRLAIIRTRPLPNGPATQRLVEEFRQAGGVMVSPAEADLRVLFAVRRMMTEKTPLLDEWLASRRPVTRLPLMAELIPCLAASLAPSPVSMVDQTIQTKQVAALSQATDSQPLPAFTSSLSAGDKAFHVEMLEANESHKATSRDEGEAIVALDTTYSQPSPSGIGAANDCAEPVPDTTDQNAKRTISWLSCGQEAQAGEMQSFPLKQFSHHTAILAGAGAGKTVLLRRLIEEAALHDTPSIVIDCANDLSALGQAWPAAPDGWLADDPLRAEDYRRKTEVVVWTPGKDQGNPLHLQLLPDFAALRHDQEELKEAIQLACEALRPIVATGSGQTATTKVGILGKAMNHFAHHGGASLSNFADLLSELPEEASLGVQKESKLARDMADALRVQMNMDPLFQSRGQSLDPAVLFGDVPGCHKVRISVISLIGLPSLEMQQQFLNRLAMTLFGWIKKNPCPPNRSLRGLLAIDEARDYVPSIKATACKSSLQQLTAQARKYGLGLIFATQHAKDIDSKIVANCSTQFYGKANSPASIDAIREQIRLRGGDGYDVPKLGKGAFYFYASDVGLKKPRKLHVPNCLSYHPPNPLDADQIMTLARESQQRLTSQFGSKVAVATPLTEMPVSNSTPLLNVPV